MTTLAVTGHMDLTEDTVAGVRAELRKLLERYEPTRLVGLSCLAQGADSLFAEAVLAAGGRLVAVWDGRAPGAKGGGTADVVAGARDAGLPVDVVWPSGAARRM
ncbi:hypothetical protein [Streptomyces sp. ODS28]|uniref:hypothetical protein n=1 Tax=Streptomyces sp. ODS28 TaxID=3136688 RepID=UPI0031E956DE